MATDIVGAGDDGGKGGKEAIPQESLASTLDSVEGSSSGLHVKLKLFEVKSCGVGVIVIQI